MTTTSPASQTAGIAVDLLEELLLELRSTAGEMDRKRIEQALQRAIESLTRLASHDAKAQDHVEVLSGAQGDLNRAKSDVEDSFYGAGAERFLRVMTNVEAALDASREETIESVVRQQDAVLSRARGGDEQAPKSVVQPAGLASGGIPCLYRLERQPLRAELDIGALDDLGGATDVDAPDPDDEPDLLDLDMGEVIEPEQLDEMQGDDIRRLEVLGEDGPPEELSLAQAGAVGEIEHARRLARDCLEEIGSLGNLRMLRPQERWSAGIARFEDRLLVDMDALLTLGAPFFSCSGDGRHQGLDIPAEAMAYARAAFTADPMRTFARAFVLGCIEGSDTVRAAVLGLRQSHPLTLESQAQALALGTNPAIGPAMVRLTRVDDTRIVKTALDVLYMRGEADIGAIAPLVEHGDERIRASAVRCMGAVEQKEAAAQVLVGMVDAEVEDEVLAAAAEALVLLGSPAGLPAVRDRLTEEADDEGILLESAKHCLMDVLALCGGRADAALLARCYTGHPRESEALGFHGHISLVEPLIGTLERATLADKHKKDAARALLRITGAPLLEPAQQVDHDAYDATTLAPMWRQWWKENEERFSEELKYRSGAPLTARQPLEELREDNVPNGYRDKCAFELGMMLGARPLNVHDWSVLQQQRLAEMGATIDRADDAGEPIHKPGRFLAG